MGGGPSEPSPLRPPEIVGKRQPQQAPVDAGDPLRKLTMEVFDPLSGSPPGLAQDVGELQDLLSVLDREAGSLRQGLEVVRAGLDLVPLVSGQQARMHARPPGEVPLRLSGEGAED